MTQQPENDTDICDGEPLTLMPWMVRTLGPEFAGEFMRRVRVEMQSQAPNGHSMSPRELQIAAEYEVRKRCVAERSQLGELLGGMQTYARTHFDEDEDD